jgi:hypothetical protein
VSHVKGAVFATQRVLARCTAAAAGQLHSHTAKRQVPVWRSSACMSSFLACLPCATATASRTEYKISQQQGMCTRALAAARVCYCACITGSPCRAACGPAGKSRSCQTGSCRSRTPAQGRGPKSATGMTPGPHRTCLACAGTARTRRKARRLQLKVRTHAIPCGLLAKVSSGRTVGKLRTYRGGQSAKDARLLRSASAPSVPAVTHGRRVCGDGRCRCGSAQDQNRNGGCCVARLHSLSLTDSHLAPCRAVDPAQHQ